MQQVETKKKQPLLKVENLRKSFPVRSPFGFKTGEVKAVNGISFEIFEGETFGIVGESGCGKSTAGRTLLKLTEPTGGNVYYNDENIFEMKEKDFLNIRQDFQMIFQDPYASLDPKKRIGYSVEEPMIIHGVGNRRARRQRVLELLKKVGFDEDAYDKFPHEFSGGQRQRIGIARALVLDPKLIVCDEPVSALDVSIQSSVLNLLKRLQSDFQLSYLFIAHDLSVVRYIADRIGVMYLGQLVETADTDDLFENPLHPYTESLLSAIPIPDPGVKKERIVLKGDVPSPLNPPSGCVFHTRCPKAMDICKMVVPKRIQMGKGHEVQCHLYN